MRPAFLVVLLLALLGCSQDRRDVIQYFKSIDAHQRKLGELQRRVSDVSDLPRDQRPAAYRALAQEAEAASRAVAALTPPAPAQRYHDQLVAMFGDFQKFAALTGDRVDQKLPSEDRTLAKEQVEKLQAEWPARLKDLKTEQDVLAARYGLKFQE